MVYELCSNTSQVDLINILLVRLGELFEILCNENYLKYFLNGLITFPVKDNQFVSFPGK